MGKERFRKERKELFDDIEELLKREMDGKVLPEEIARTFNWALYSEFGKTREIEGGATYSLKPIFVGQYRIDLENPTQTRVYSGPGTHACSPLPICRGVIGRAIRTGEDQYVPDVTKDQDHIACDEEMQGTEIVFPSWSEPYTHGEYKGQRVPLGVLDIDLNVNDAFSQEDIKRLKKIWLPYGKLIFPGEPNFTPPEIMARSNNHKK